MRILFVLAGLHRVNRGAEVTFISVARELAKIGHEVTLMGSGKYRGGEPYRFLSVPSVHRSNFFSWPRYPRTTTKVIYRAKDHGSDS